MFGPNYGAAQSHIAELMQEREDFVQASKAQSRRVAELEASLAAATEVHGAAQEQLEVQSLIAEHRANRINELEKETREKDTTMGKCDCATPCVFGLVAAGATQPPLLSPRYLTRIH